MEPTPHKDCYRHKIKWYFGARMPPPFIHTSLLGERQRRTKLKTRTQMAACWNTPPPSGKRESEQEGKGWGQREQGEPAAGGLQMWWLWGQATLALFRPPVLTLFFPLLHLLSQWQEPSGLAERAETQHSPTLPSVAPACHSAESTSK